MDIDRTVHEMEQAANILLVSKLLIIRSVNEHSEFYGSKNIFFLLVFYRPKMIFPTFLFGLIDAQRKEI